MSNSFNLNQEYSYGPYTYRLEAAIDSDGDVDEVLFIETCSDDEDGMKKEMSLLYDDIVQIYGMFSNLLLAINNNIKNKQKHHFRIPND